MPDPQLALPAKHVQRGGKWVVVDANGKRVAGSGSFDDEGEAKGIASSINDAWKRAASERKSKGSPAVTREARVGRLAGQITSLIEAKPFNPSLHPRTRTGEWAKKLAPAIAAAKKQGVDLEKAFAPHSLSPHTESHLGPGIHAERVEQRAQGASAVLESGTAIPDAVLHLPDEGARRQRIVGKLAYQGGTAREKAQAEYRETPVADLEQLGGVAIDMEKPVFGQANANLVTRQLHFGTSSVTGDYRHELGHTLRASMSGKGGPTAHTPLTTFIAKEHQAALARREANIQAGKPKPPTEQEWENQLGIIDPRSLDSFEEFIAEHYRAYHRSVFRSTHPEVSDADPNALKLYRKNHPEMAKFWDAWYTAQLAGRVPDPLTSELAAALIEEAKFGHVIFNPALHPHGRAGRFAETLGSMHEGQEAHTTAGVRVVKHGPGHFEIRDPYFGEAVAHHKGTDASAAAAKQALMIHDEVASHGARVVDEKGKTVGRYTSKAQAKRNAKPGHKVRPILEESRLEESVMEVLSRAPAVHVRFDPRLHGRDRLGKFTEMFDRLEHGGPGSSIHLPHDITVTKTRLGRYRVTRPGHETLTHSTPVGAAAHALGHVNAGEVEHGAERSVLHAHRIAELEDARNQVMKAGSMVDLSRVDEMLRRTHLVHDAGGIPRSNPRGRSHASVQHYAAAHGGSVEPLVDAVNRIRVQRRAVEHLPAASADARADAVKPKLEHDRVITGYGEYRLEPHPQASGVMRLLHDGKPVETVANKHGEHVLLAIHDEAMARHQMAHKRKLAA